MTTAETIKTLRTGAGFSQAKLASLLKTKSGKPLAQNKITEWEAGKKEPSYKTMMQIIEICKTKPNENAKL